ncbi:unnamed protein product [Closterium sp. NIES-53]
MTSESYCFSSQIPFLLLVVSFYCTRAADRHDKLLGALKYATRPRVYLPTPPFPPFRTSLRPSPLPDIPEGDPGCKQWGGRAGDRRICTWFWSVLVDATTTAATTTAAAATAAGTAGAAGSAASAAAAAAGAAGASAAGGGAAGGGACGVVLPPVLVAPQCYVVQQRHEDVFLLLTTTQEMPPLMALDVSESCEVRSIPCVPVYIKPQIAFVQDSGRVNVMVGVKHDPGKPVEGLVLLLPLPMQVASCDLQANVGTVAFDTVTKLCTWSIGRMPRDKNPCLSGGLRLSSPLPRPHVHPVLLAQFRIMGAALSGVRIESVVVRGEENRRPHTAFRSATVAGCFQVRT